MQIVGFRFRFLRLLLSTSCASGGLVCFPTKFHQIHPFRFCIKLTDNFFIWMIWFLSIMKKSRNGASKSMPWFWFIPEQSCDSLSSERMLILLSLNASVLAYPMKPRSLKKKSARCGGNLSKLETLNFAAMILGLQSVAKVNTTYILETNTCHQNI